MRSWQTCRSSLALLFVSAWCRPSCMPILTRQVGVWRGCQQTPLRSGRCRLAGRVPARPPLAADPSHTLKGAAPTSAPPRRQPRGTRVFVRHRHSRHDSKAQKTFTIPNGGSTALQSRSHLLRELCHGSRARRSTPPPSPLLPQPPPSDPPPPSILISVGASSSSQ